MILINVMLIIEKKRVPATYTWAEYKWGQKDPVTGQWSGVVGQVQ